MALSSLYCRLNKGKSISSYQHLVMAPYPWVSSVGLGGSCWYFLHAGKMCDSLCYTHVTQHFTCAGYLWEKPSESQTLLALSSQNSGSSSSEGWPRVQISSSKAVGSLIVSWRNQVEMTQSPKRKANQQLTTLTEVCCVFFMSARVQNSQQVLNAMNFQELNLRKLNFR